MPTLPERIGPYRLLESLGEGGMGVVYRARHVELGQLVAIKTVRQVHANLVEHLRREIYALSRIRHPGVVKVVAQGDHEAVPWYAMQLLEGTTLKDHFRGAAGSRNGESEAGSLEDQTATFASFEETVAFLGVEAEEALTRHSVDLPAAERDGADPPTSVEVRTPAAPDEALREILTIVRRLCSPLAFVHGEGIVHCDLKPDNVFLDRNGLAVLADFGLVSMVGGTVGRETLEVEAGLRGTARYMSPEQIRGEQVDPRSDLYSLGCMLYEMTVGHPPFQGPVQSVLKQHLSAQPVPPSELVDGIDPELNQMMLKLLAKRPSERLGYADDVAATLVRLGADPEDPVELPRPRAYIYRPDFVGRRVAMERMLFLLDRAFSGSGSLVLVGGESGVGKTRFVSELGIQGASLGFQVLTGQCQDRGSEETARGTALGLPFHPFRPLLRSIADRCHEGGPEETERLLGPRAPVLASYEPLLREVPGFDRLEPPVRLSPEAARQRLFAYLTNSLAALAETRPLVLILDDLQWADPLTLAYLHSHQRRRLTESRILILGTYRIEQVGADLRRIVEDDGIEKLVLERLAQSDVGSIVGDMLAMEQALSGFVRFLTRQSEGNPFFVAEFLRTAVTEQILVRDSSGRWGFSISSDEAEVAYDSLPLPSSLKELAGLRLRGLSPTARKIAEMASVLGREVRPEIVVDALELTLDEGRKAIQELRARQVVEYIETGQVRFLHDKLREISYDEIPLEIRSRLHRRAAETITVDRGAASDLEWHAELGRHWSLANAPQRAIDHLSEAGRLAQEVHANQQAIEYLKSALEQVELARSSGCDDVTWARRLVALSEELGIVLALVGRQEEARRAFDRALDGLPAGGGIRRARLHRRIGKTWEVHHVHDSAAQSYDRAEQALERAARDDPWWHEWLDIQLRRGWLAYWGAKVEELEEWLRRARPAMEERATPIQRTTFFQLLENLGLRQERYQASDDSLHNASQAYEAAVESQLAQEVANALFERGFAYLFHGDLEQAQTDLMAALEQGRKIGDLTVQSRCLTYLTMAQRRSGLVEEARGSAEEAIRVAHESGMFDYLAAAKANLGWVSWRLGEQEAARTGCQEALNTWKPMDLAYPFEWMALLPLFAMALESEDFEALPELAAELLNPAQQRLPDALSEALEQSHVESTARDRGAARRSAIRAVRVAEAEGFL